MELLFIWGLFVTAAWKSESVSHSVVYASLQPHELYLACQAPRPWNSLGKNPGVGSHPLLQGIFLTQGLNLGLLHCRGIIYRLSHQGSPLQQPNSSQLTHASKYISQTYNKRWISKVQEEDKFLVRKAQALWLHLTGLYILWKGIIISKRQCCMVLPVWI